MDSSSPAPVSLRGYLTIGEAAQYLGVSRSTLRNWDRAGKLTARRHPVNGYRLYKDEELERLLARLDSAQQAPEGSGN